MFNTIYKYGKLIKFSHSIFALPFALSSVVLCYSYYPEQFTWFKLFWIVVAMITARSAAMGFNRYVDRELDARNPRTMNREIPKGVISPLQTLAFIIISIIIFIISAAQLNDLALLLSPVALIVILGYSLTKRFTHFSHIFLGLGLGIAPLGAWIAITGQFDIIPAVLALGVTFWVAGFDVIYSCQDYEFDVNNGMHSIPVWSGIRGALIMSKLFHFLAAVAFLFLGYYAQLHWIYFIGISAIVLLMIYENRLINENDFTKIDMAFFNLNGLISVSFFIIIAISAWIK